MNWKLVNVVSVSMLRVKKTLGIIGLSVSLQHLVKNPVRVFLGVTEKTLEKQEFHWSKPARVHKGKVSELQHHRIGKFGGNHSGPSGPTSLLKHRIILEHVAKNCSQKIIEHPQCGRLLSGKSVSVVSHLHSKDVLPHIQELSEHQFQPIVICLITWCH